MKVRILIFILSFFACLQFWASFSIASEGDPEPDSEAGLTALRDELSEGFHYSLRFLTYGTCYNIADSTQNPDNDFLQIQSYSGEVDLRPDFGLNFRRLDLSIKPRMNLQWKAWEDGTRKGDKDWEDDWFINEWLARARLLENLFVSYGRENLQWGPSFLYSPSNPFFSDNGRINPRQEVAGMDFARLVWLPGPAWTVSLIANTGKGRQVFRVRPFEKSYGLKLDYAGQEGYAGLILSRKSGDGNRLGLFGGWTATDALLLYCDTALFEGSDLLYPVEDNLSPFGASFRAIDEDTSSKRETILLGGSYTFLAGPTLTMEYLYNGTGYNNHQAEMYYQLRKQASDAYKTPFGGLSRMTLGQAVDTGLRFLRRNYAVIQYRQSDIRDLLNITLSWVQNIDEDSGSFISLVDFYVGDHIQVFTIGTVNAGNGDTEFRAILDCHLMIGLEYTF